MKVVIAKIRQVGSNRLEACRLFDTVTGEVKDTHCNKIKQMVLNGGQKVVGYKTQVITNYSNLGTRIQVKPEIGRFNMGKVPEINGKGELKNEEDARTLTVCGWQGFAENKSYCCYDYVGNKHVLGLEEFRERVSREEVNGAKISSRTGKILIFGDLNKEIED